MTAWLLLGVAVIANVFTNVALKRAAASIDLEAFPKSVPSLLLNPWLWGGGVSALILVGAYMLAIRSLPLSVGYVSVTSMAMVGITAVGLLSGTETVSVVRLLGMSLVLVGVILVGTSTS